MRELLSTIQPEEFDSTVYPQLVTGHMVGQKTLDDDFLLYPNPEKYKTETHEVTVDEIQKSVVGWEMSLPIPAEHNTPHNRLKRGIEEFKELKQAVTNYDGTTETAYQVGEEATDVIIRMIGIMSSVNMQTGYMLVKKLNLMHEKYQPFKHRELRNGGMSFEQAMTHQKQIYKNEH